MSHFSPKILTNGLICHFDAANPNWNTGQKINDLTSNEYNGDLVSATWSSSNLGVLDMDITSKIVLPPLPLLNVDKFTIQIWAKFDGTKFAAFFSVGSPGSIPNDILFAYEFSFGNSYIFGQVNNAGDGTGYFNYIPDNTWNNFVMVYNGNGIGNSNRMKIYLNGVEQILTYTYTVPATTLSTATDYEVGNYVCVGPGNYNLSGSISNFSIYNRDLSSTEIKNNYLALRSRFS